MICLHFAGFHFVNRKKKTLKIEDEDFAAYVEWLICNDPDDDAWMRRRMANFYIRFLGRFGREREDDDNDSENDEAGPNSNSSPLPTSPLPQITFDKSLPNTHEYLGGDLEELQGRTILDDDSFITLPLLPMHGVVLIPGQTLPLHLYEQRDVLMIKRILDRDKTFGQVTQDHSFGLAGIGTTAEVLAYKDITDDLSGISTAKVKAIGRQRFKVIEVRRQTDGILTAKVCILPEVTLSPALAGVQPPSFKRGAAVGDSHPIKHLTGVNVSQHKKLQRRMRRVDMLSGSHLTGRPSWLYHLYDPAHLMTRIRDELLSWNESFDVTSLPEDPAEFSYWVAGMLPLDDTTKLLLLQTDSAVHRLRIEIDVMQRCTVLCCKQCGRQIANKQEVFSMSVKGPLGAYVNPHGHVHETLTLHAAHNLKLRGRPSTEASWFPGYAWTIAECRGCHSHMGWKFTRAVSRPLKPETFWGLCRASLTPNLDTELGEGEDQPPSTPSSLVPSV